MLTANIPNTIRRAVYKRDGYRCALCDSTRGLQIHHVVSRGQGGTDFPHNLITLCWRCHAVAHGTSLPEYGLMNAYEIGQACIEYISDHYANEGYVWNPWEKNMGRCWGP